jgi:hypothetical protein
MQIAGRPVTALLALAAALALIGCTPTAGSLGTPSSPAPTGDASVAPPSGDATPGPTAAASTTPAPAPPSPSSSAASPTPAAATVTAAPVPSGTALVRAYFVLGAGGLVPVLRTIPATTGVAAAAMRQLIAGPTATELGANPAIGSAVPPSTRLLGLAITNGVATVNLSSEFLTGYSPSAPDARYGQVVYTLTQFTTVKSVVLQFDGQASSGIAGQRSANQDQLLRAISVDHPAWGAGAAHPVLVSGVANVFEATFRVQVKDANAKVLADQQVTASCGTGCWGAFSTSVAYAVTKAQWGTLRVFDLSAKDGTPENVTEYPVWLTPPG